MFQFLEDVIYIQKRKIFHHKKIEIHHIAYLIIQSKPMGFSVELFKWVVEGETTYWEHVQTVHENIIYSVGERFTKTIQRDFNENIPEKFCWGRGVYDDGWCLASDEGSSDDVTKIPLSMLKQAWENAYGESLNIKHELSDDTIVCLATGR